MGRILERMDIAQRHVEKEVPGKALDQATANAQRPRSAIWRIKHYSNVELGQRGGLAGAPQAVETLCRSHAAFLRPPASSRNVVQTAEFLQRLPQAI